jgi:hypothetical protein
MINKRSAAICGAAEVQRVTENAPSWPEVNTPIIGHGVGGDMDARRPTSVPITVVSKLLCPVVARRVSVDMSALSPLSEDQWKRRTSHRLAQLKGSEVAVGCKNRCYVRSDIRS